MAKIYFNLIKKGLRKLEDIKPESLRKQVEELLKNESEL